MKTKYLEKLFLQLILLIFSIFQIFFVKKFNLNIVVAIIAILSIIYTLLIKDKKKKEEYSKDFLLIATIIILSYYLITYVIGFFTGFVYTTYSRRLFGILQNVILQIILVVSIEQLRYKIIATSKYYKSLVILTILTLSAVEATTFISTNINDIYIIFETFLGLFIPCLSLNCALTYVCYKSDYKNSIIIHLLMNVPTYFLPFFPDLGDYFRTLILTLLPFLIITIQEVLSVNKREQKRDTRNDIKNAKLRKVFSLVSLVLAFLIIYFTSGLGRYSTYAIASESMTGVLNKYDIAVIDKKNKEPYKINDIIAYEMDKRIIIHRIVDIQSDNKKQFYITKGDYNNSIDVWNVYDEQIIGRYKFRIMFLGYPTISLSELISK